MSKKSAFNSKNTAPLNAVSPLNKGEINQGTHNIKVKLINYPDEKRFKFALSKMVNATIGGNIDEQDNTGIGLEMFSGGLQTGLESGVFTFEISGVSRAFTHQLVRTRKAAYHQQSSRFTFMGEKFNVRMPETIAKNPVTKEIFKAFVWESRYAYRKLVDNNIPYQDARFACPVGIETYIIAEMPIKTFLDTYAYRACPMFQWEMVFVMNLMKKEVVQLMPWMEKYIQISCTKTKKCMFQGFEETEDFCDFEWAGDRVFESEITKKHKDEKEKFYQEELDLK